MSVIFRKLIPINSQVFLSLSLLVAVTLAEPPRYRQQYQSESNKYYFARQQQQQEAEIPAEAPYQASGWKPAGPSFELPQKQQAASPNQEYGTPAFDSQQQYGAPQAAPQNQYGAPTFPQQQYKASQRQSSAVASSQEQQYGAPQAAPQNQYGAPVVPQQQYRVPAAPQGQYAGYAAPQQQYGAPQAAPQQQYGEPQAAPRQQYGAPQATPQNQYGAPTFTQKFYGTPAAPQQSYGAPEMTTTQESTDFEDSTALPGGTESQVLEQYCTLYNSNPNCRLNTGCILCIGNGGVKERIFFVYLLLDVWPARWWARWNLNRRINSLPVSFTRLVFTTSFTFHPGVYGGHG